MLWWWAAILLYSVLTVLMLKDPDMLLLGNVSRITGNIVFGAVSAVILVWSVVFFYRLRSMAVNATSINGMVCKYCGYDLRAATETRCPECGRSFDAQELRNYWHRCTRRFR